VVEALDKLVSEKQVKRIVIAGEKVILPELWRQLPPALRDHVIEASGLDMHTPEDELKRLTSELVDEVDAKVDRSDVERLFDEQRSGGLGAVGAKDVLAALDQGQVDQLLIAASLSELRHDGGIPGVTGSAPGHKVIIAESPQRTDPGQAWLANQLVTGTLRTRARLRFIEDPGLLAPAGGVGALLRYRTTPGAGTKGGPSNGS
jgi:peptide subunit release factor 1 (eRF1)